MIAGLIDEYFSGPTTIRKEQIYTSLTSEVDNNSLSLEKIIDVVIETMGTDKGKIANALHLFFELISRTSVDFV